MRKRCKSKNKNITFVPRGLRQPSTSKPTSSNMKREPKTTPESTWSPLNDRIISEQDMNDYKNQNSQFLDGPKKNKRLQGLKSWEKKKKKEHNSSDSTGSKHRTLILTAQIQSAQQGRAVRQAKKQPTPRRAQNCTSATPFYLEQTKLISIENLLNSNVAESIMT
ncbi:hypothetical protein M0R45_005339 [Rubus argutus]|uniref:Uncharacterized protein n=1 Tax=Rubus argutus TaxID=59490 RepID=A0AAW1YMD6_RUBAR